MLSAVSPQMWMGVAAIVIVIIALGMYSKRRPAPVIEVPTAPIPDPTDLRPAQPAQATANLPLGPGPIATTAELSKTWSSKRFLFRAPETAEDVPAMVVKLPGDVLWAISMRAPFGTCDLEYVTNMQRLASQYHLTADHPMVADSCAHTVYDLMRYGSGPNGVVRGAIVKGEGIRPPIAIEVRARGKEVVASRIEP
jgi:hypothetical protein